MAAIGQAQSVPLFRRDCPERPQCSDCSRPRFAVELRTIGQKQPVAIANVVRKVGGQRQASSAASLIG